MSNFNKPLKEVKETELLRKITAGPKKASEHELLRSGKMLIGNRELSDQTDRKPPKTAVMRKLKGRSAFRRKTASGFKTMNKENFRSLRTIDGKTRAIANDIHLRAARTGITCGLRSAAVTTLISRNVIKHRIMQNHVPAGNTAVLVRDATIRGLLLLERTRA